MVVTENGWSYILTDYADKFGSMLNSMLFFHSFYLLIKYIILSLLTGLVWEIFTIISNNLGKKLQGKDKNQGKAEEKDSDSDDLESSEEEIKLREVYLEELVNPVDSNILFLREKLKATKKDNLKMHEVVLLRDDYSFAKNQNTSAEEYKQIEGNS